MFSQSHVTLYIYMVGRSWPIRKFFYKYKLGGTGQTVPLDVQILQKSYLPHPASKLDIPHTNLDLLDETYIMVK
jgi:hypothetical protein